MSRIILTTADAGYCDVLRTFLFSLRHHGNMEKVRCDCIGYSEEQKRRVMACGENIEVVDVELPDGEGKELLRLMWTRPRQMMKALEEGWDQVCSMDCDVVVRGNLSAVWDNVLPGVFKIMDKAYYRKTSTKTRFQGGVYFFGNSPEVRAFYADVMEEIGTRFGFYDGQEALLKVFRAHAKKVKWQQLDRCYNDEQNGEWSKKSFVWHAKHGRILKEPFASEAAKYLEMCNARG